MKVLYIHNRYQYRGGEDTTLQVEKELLTARGHQTDLLEFNNDTIGSFASKITVGVRSFYNAQSANSVKQAIAAFNPDIIHIHNLFFSASPSVLFAAYKMKVPVVMTVQNFRLICANALLLRNNHVCELCTQKVFPLHGIRYKCYRSSAIESALVTAVTGVHKALHTWQHKIQTIVVPSVFMKDKLTFSSLRPREDQIVIKPNFVADYFSNDQVRENYFLFAGRIAKEKGIDTLLRPFLEDKNLRLVIAGDGPEKENLVAAIKDASNISYIGLQEKTALLSLMKKSIALVFPSVWYEGQPLTILEALSAGTPVIASRLGAMSELIQDGVNGYLFAPGDATALQQCLAKFSHDTTSCASLYVNARQSYLDRYTENIHYNNIMDIYNQAIKNRTS